jgi:hypothetical protein
MSDLKAVSIIICFITVFGLFVFASNQIFPDYTLIESTTSESYDKPVEDWTAFGFLNPFTYINYFYDILTFEVFGLPDDLQTFLQMAVYVPLAGITLIIVLYFARGN